MQKMSKSPRQRDRRRAIAPAEMFGAMMSISDELMMRYYELLSDRPTSTELDGRCARGASTRWKPRSSSPPRWSPASTATAAAARRARRSRRRFQQRRAAGGRSERLLGRDGSGRSRVCRVLHETGLAASQGRGPAAGGAGGVRIDGERVVDPEPTASPPRGRCWSRSGSGGLLRVVFGTDRKSRAGSRSPKA